MKSVLRTPAGRLVIAIAAAVSLLVAGVAFWQTEVMRERELQSIQRQAELQARAFGEHGDSIVRLVDLALTELVRNWRDFDAFHGQSVQIAERLGNLSVQIGAADDQGNLRSTNGAPPNPPVRLADREHIRVHLDGRVAGLFISDPVLGRVSKKWSIQFTRAVRREGVLLAVIVISIDPRYFSDFYGHMSSRQEGDAIAMVKPNGVILARAPEPDRYLGRSVRSLPHQQAGSAPAGSYRARSQTDGVDRVVGWYKAPYSGLTLTTGIGVESAMAGLERDRSLLLIASVTMCLVVWMAAVAALGYLRRRSAAVDTLQAAQVRLESAVEERTASLRATLDQLQASQQDLLLARSALASASNGIVIADAAQADMPLIYVNDAFERITGYARDEALGRNCRFLHRADPDQPELVDLRMALREGRSCRVRLRNQRKNGELFYNDLSISPLRDPNGVVSHFVGIQTDVTDRVRLEEQIRETQKMDAIGQLTGGLAHDFNNLLGVVIGNLDLLADKVPPDESSRRQHRTALDAALRGAEVTRSLLAVARRQPMDARLHDLNGLVAEMLPLVRSSAGSSIVVRSQLWHEELPARLDASGLSNALLNLVINARDAMVDWEGERRLTLSTDRWTLQPGQDPQLAAGDYAVLQVADSGPGMPEAVRQRAFEPFFTTKPTGRGTGLGLPMVLGFAEQLGGTVRIDSAPNAGTRVHLILPLVNVDAHTSDLPGPSAAGR